MADTAEDIIKELAAKRGNPPVIGGVVIHDVIGVGGMGAVFRGTHLRLRIPVAVKFLFHHEQEQVKRFKDEAAFAAKVNHPNVVRVYDVGDEDGFLYIVQEYVEGRSAAQRFQDLQPGQALSEDFVLALGADVARGLAAMHAEKLLHLDVKPSNILISEKDGLCKILDLGVAQRFEVCRRGGGKRHEGPAEDVFGTPGYASPEQVLGQAATPASDVYGLGVSMYELLTGQYVTPTGSWVPPTTPETIEELPNLRTVRPSASVATAALIRRCVRVDPRKRFQNALDLLAHIIEITEKRPVLVGAAAKMTGAAAAPARNRKVSEDASPYEANGSPAPTVFCVDDDARLCGVLEEILEDAGCHVRTFTDGATALKEMEKTTPNVVILDLEMPGMSGLDICRAMRFQDSLKNTPVVFLTASAELDKMDRALHEGATDYLFKPVQAGELVARVRCLTRISQVQQEYAVLQHQYGSFRKRLTKLLARDAV